MQPEKVSEEDCEKARRALYAAFTLLFSDAVARMEQDRFEKLAGHVRKMHAAIASAVIGYDTSRTPQDTDDRAQAMADDLATAILEQISYADESVKARFGGDKSSGT